MDKKKAIHIITNSAKLYHDNLENQKILFLYGIPSEVKKQIADKVKVLTSINGYEVVFYKQNFLHLTGVRVNTSKVKSSVHFYEKSLNNRLTEEDFSFSNDGSTVQKLNILENMMMIKKNVAMIGEFTDKGPKLYAEKIAGNVCACIGFVRDKYTELNVPNTLLKKDIRDVVAKPVEKVYVVLSKKYNDEKYIRIEKFDKEIEFEKVRFREELEYIIDIRNK